jgi:hypothetical protein
MPQPEHQHDDQGLVGGGCGRVLAGGLSGMVNQAQERFLTNILALLGGKPAQMPQDYAACIGARSRVEIKTASEGFLESFDDESVARSGDRVEVRMGRVVEPIATLQLSHSAPMLGEHGGHPWELRIGGEVTAEQEHELDVVTDRSTLGEADRPRSLNSLLDDTAEAIIAEAAGVVRCICMQ